MVTFEFYNKRTHCMETTSLSNDVFKKVISASRKCGLSDNVYNVR